MTEIETMSRAEIENKFRELNERLEIVERLAKTEYYRYGIW